MNIEEITPPGFTPQPLPGDPNWLPEQDPTIERMPSREGLSLFQRAQLEELGQKFKMTPATQAFFLENRKLGPGEPLKWYPAPFLSSVSLKIALGVARGGARIILSAPPRHGKSKISTEHGPLWVLENFSDKNVVTTTYGADLAEDFARAIRDHITYNPDILEVRLRTDANRIAKFLTNKGGALTSIGLGGPITGRGADVLFIDDYIKQIKEANSQAYRDFCWDWFRSTAMTRLEPGASVIIVATRWHHDDLIGRIIRNFGTTQDGGDWDYIKYHAIARANDPLNRQIGEALFPQRYSVKTLNERKRVLGTQYYDAIFDQEPHESTQNLTKKEWIVKRKLSEIPKKPLKFVRVWDFAGSKEESADFTAGGLICGDLETKNCGLMNMIRDKLSAAECEAKVKNTAESDGPNVHIVICQETGSAGKAVVDFYRRNVLSGYRVTGHYWNTGKVIVAQPWLAACESGHFWILDDGTEGHDDGWNAQFIREFGTFPAEGSGYHDDQMDVCSNGYIYLFGKRKKAGGIRGSKASDSPEIPVDTAEAARIMLEKSKNSPHLLLGNSKTFDMASRSRTTFGRRKARMSMH